MAATEEDAGWGPIGLTCTLRFIFPTAEAPAAGTMVRSQELRHDKTRNWGIRLHLQSACGIAFHSAEETASTGSIALFSNGNWYA